MKMPPLMISTLPPIIPSPETSAVGNDFDLDPARSQNRFKGKNFFSPIVILILHMYALSMSVLSSLGASEIPIPFEYNYDYHRIESDWGVPEAAHLPVGDFISLTGTKFSIPLQGSNVWHSLYDDDGILDIHMNLKGVSEVRGLINTFWGEDLPQSFAYVEFLGTGGAYFRKDLDGGTDIRDYLLNVYQNSIDFGHTENAFIYSPGVQLHEVRLDEVRFELPLIFRRETLIAIRIVDLGSRDFQKVFVAGLTAIGGDQIHIVLSPASLKIGAYAGVDITGTPGAEYRIEWAPSANSSEWNSLETIFLPSTNYLYVDRTSSPLQGMRVYRAVGVEPQ